MAYQNSIPGPNDLLSQSQADIQGNFAAIQTLIGINHVNFNAVGAGKHLYLQMPEHSAPTTAGNEAGFYANVGPTSNITELFFRREGNGVSIPMTETVNTSATNGWTYLPSGVILQWGRAATVAGNGNAGVVISFPRVFSAPCLNLQLSATNNGNNTILMVQKSVNATNFTVYSRSGDDSAYTTSNFYFFALGV